ncbi:hypothetical protein GGX14DRAFT_408395 [Mycena pura]|uniref:Uncharacterized protein n=1 Tax=Mycena pura TaxID=153505 RepID=A0AAD6XXS9_9AGAR|nr:hypothetical protein GGX14DRAFT_408395 [Mycena pura]
MEHPAQMTQSRNGAEVWEDWDARDIPNSDKYITHFEYLKGKMDGTELRVQRSVQSGSGSNRLSEPDLASTSQESVSDGGASEWKTHGSPEGRLISAIEAAQTLVSAVHGTVEVGENECKDKRLKCQHILIKLVVLPHSYGLVWVLAPPGSTNPRPMSTDIGQLPVGRLGRGPSANLGRRPTTSANISSTPQMSHNITIPKEIFQKPTRTQVPSELNSWVPVTGDARA